MHSRRPLAFVRALALLFVTLTAFALGGNAHAERLKDLATIRGVASNPLVGYGLVVGLAGTGDNLQSAQTQQMVANLLGRRFGTIITPQQIKAKNVAVVMVTARLPPFSRIGGRIDVTVSSASNAKSLFGGTLLPTALKGGNGETYAWAEGPLMVGGWAADGKSGSGVSKNHPTVGQVPDGGLVAKELGFKLSADKPLTVALDRPDFTTAARVSEAINERLGAVVAHAPDPGTVLVDVPKSRRKDIVRLVATIENLQIAPDQNARVVINEKTGTVVMGADVEVMACAVSHGSLTVQVDERQEVSQPGTLARGSTQTVQRSDVSVTEDGGDIAVLGPAPTLGDVVASLNSLGVSPRDLVAILLAMKQAGALRAEVEVQ
ncbi:MAG: flagellar basal body P-ring protein FlgI [Nannocystaceae bacterium]